VQVLPIDLPNALRLANASNPTIAVAQTRVQEAFYALRQAEVAWLPNLDAGPTYVRHDGQLQNSSGLVFPVSKQNFFIGGGAAMSVDTSSARFGPLIARRLLQAQTATAQAVTDHIQLDVALAYLDLLPAYGALAVNAATLDMARYMTREAEAAVRAGLGKTPADVNRARTELDLRLQERVGLEAQAAQVSARLAQFLLLEPTVDLRPAEPTLVPISLVPPEAPLQEMVATGLMNRPELAADRALVSAALARWRQSQVGPLFPRLEVSYAAGDFGGGTHDELGHWGSRGDGQAQAVWELRNFGLGNVYDARTRRAEFTEANLHVTELEAQIGAEVTAAAKTVRAHWRNLQTAQEGVQQAENMWARLQRLVFGMAGPARQWDPLEALLAEQALNQARQQYVNEVVNYNKAQFQLYTAMGQPPLEALPRAVCVPVPFPAAPVSSRSPTGR
ncbi:MAG: TolC family protein, partial [Planctomycetes bacterium]|nr:TolC family protein [Planctomycetota bacterium]